MKNLKLKREFLGEIGHIKDRSRKNFEKKHLKAYLRGDSFFTYGRDKEGRPITHIVKSKLYDIENKETI